MERIQKLLAAAGVGSRRGIEEWLRAGRLTVNGSVAKLGDRAGPGDVFLLDGKPLELPNAGAPSGGVDPAAGTGTTVLLYHKPTGEVTTRLHGLNAGNAQHVDRCRARFRPCLVCSACRAYCTT